MTIRLPVALPPGDQATALPAARRVSRQVAGYVAPLALLHPPVAVALPPGEQAILLPQRRARARQDSYQAPLALLHPPAAVALPPGRTVTEVPARRARMVYQAWTQDLLSTQQPPSHSVIEYIYFARRRMRK